MAQWQRKKLLLIFERVDIFFLVRRMKEGFSLCVIVLSANGFDLTIPLITMWSESWFWKWTY